MGTGKLSESTNAALRDRRLHQVFLEPVRILLYLLLQLTDKKREHLMYHLMRHSLLHLMINARVPTRRRQHVDVIANGSHNKSISL